MLPNSYKVFCLGLDGATFDLIEPWVHQGQLPSLARHMAEGARARLESVILPFSPQAWGSFMTGVNPGKHGIFGFKSRERDKYAFQFVNNKSLKSQTLWKLLSDMNKKVIVVNIPMTYPPEEVNGIVVAGMDAPGIESNFVFPPEFKEKLFCIAGNYVIHLHIGDGYLDSDVKRRKAMKGLLEMIEAREKLVIHLMENYEWDFFAVNFSAIDQVQHHFWQFMDTESEFKDAILTIYKRVDEAIGKITARLGKETALFVLSDHGAGPASPYVFFIDEWLRENDLLKFKNTFSGASLRSLLISVLSILSRRLPSKTKDHLMRMFPRLRVRFQGFIRRSLIDWSAAKVYSGEHPSTLRINLKGREREGTVNGPEEYEALREVLIGKLEALEHPETHEKLIERVYRREDLYHGPYMESAPDLILYPRDFAHQIRGGPFLKDKNYRKILSMKDGKRFFVSGTHRVDGIFIANGPCIWRNLSIPPLRIVDLFPTILYALGLGIPQGIDGRVVTEVFIPEFLAKHPPEYVNVDLAREDRLTDGTTMYAEDESKKIEDHLREMGYID